MPPMPNEMADFIRQNHVVSLACYADNELWSASCFYTFDQENHRLLVLTKRTTQHGILMLKNPQIVGTIAGQPEQLQDIEGIQFRATARLLDNSAEKAYALTDYYRRHPIAKLHSSDVWEISFEQIKYTSNRFAFAHKTIWQAQG